MKTYTHAGQASLLEDTHLFSMAADPLTDGL